MPQQRRVANNQPVSGGSSQVPSSAPTPSSSSEVKKKRHDADIVYSQPANTGTGQDIRTQVLFAVEHIKNKNIPLKFGDIVSYLSLQHLAHDQAYIRALHHILRTHERVEYDPSGANGEGTFVFRPPHNVRNAEQLLQKLQSQSTATGMLVKELKEGWPNVEDEINELEKQGKLLVTRNKKDDHPKMIWANDPSLIEHFDDEFKQIWYKIRVPDATAVKEELERAGITPTNKNKVVGPRVAAPTKKVKKPRRSGKTTNTHMMGILRDYSHLKR
jgi:transcription initiation factor TFIIE subunit beta